MIGVSSLSNRMDSPGVFHKLIIFSYNYFVFQADICSFNPRLGFYPLSMKILYLSLPCSYMVLDLSRADDHGCVETFRTEHSLVVLTSTTVSWSCHSSIACRGLTVLSSTILSWPCRFFQSMSQFDRAVWYDCIMSVSFFPSIWGIF